MANATIRVQFGRDSSAGGHLSAEIDGRANGLNNGKTSFEAGDAVYILVYKSDNVSITDTMTSAGSLAAAGTAVVDVEEELMFEDTDTTTLNKPARGALGSVHWFGRRLGALSVQGDRSTVKAAQKGVAVAKVTYQATALVYKLTSPTQLDGQTDFTILAIIRGRAQ